jgi:hypothetical protein
VSACGLVQSVQTGDDVLRACETDGPPTLSRRHPAYSSVKTGQSCNRNGDSDESTRRSRTDIRHEGVDRLARRRKPTPCTDTGVIWAWARTQGGGLISHRVDLGMEDEDEDEDFNGEKSFSFSSMVVCLGGVCWSEQVRGWDCCVESVLRES